MEIKYTYIFCDIYDTLINDQRQIDSFTKFEIDKYNDCGGKFILVTGRNFLSAKSIYQSLHLSTPIIINQGCIYSPQNDKFIHRSFMQVESLYRLCLFLEKQKIYFQIFSNNDIFVKNKTEYSIQYIKNCGVDITETNAELSNLVLHKKIVSDKLMIECDVNIIDNLLKDLKQKFGEQFAIDKSKKWIIEISSLNNTKGYAVKHFIEHNKIERKCCMAIGDSQSDLSMFEQVGFSIAVNNSSCGFSSKVHKISKSNNEDAVGYALQKYAYLD